MSTPKLTAISSLHPPSTSHAPRTWQSIPHPRSPLGLLATASSDKSVSVWSLRDFKLLSVITGGHKRSVRTVGWKDYGDSNQVAPVTLATGSFDANVGLWTHNSSSAESTSQQIPGGDETDLTNSGYVSATSNLENENTDLHSDGEQEEWNFSTLLTGPDSEIKSVAFSPPHYSANLLATCSRDKSVWIWEEVSGSGAEEEEWETIAVLSEHTGDVKCVAWCPKQGRQVLASSGYDDTIRFWRDADEEGDWDCVGVIGGEEMGHKGTVWCIVWEEDEQKSQTDDWQPRLASCSDDMTVRLWRRVIPEQERSRQAAQREQRNGNLAPRLPSIIRPSSSTETWTEEAVLPQVHVRSIYSISWSKVTGLLVSCGGDGLIAVYREIKTPAPGLANGTSEGDGDVIMTDTQESANTVEEKVTSSWEVVAMLEEAHDEFEINHVCWAKRRDAEKRFEDEEILVSTGDDGVVRIWEIPDEVLQKH